MKSNRKRCISWLRGAPGAAVVLCLTLASAGRAEHVAVRNAMEFVRVGNPGNDADPEYWAHNNPGGGTDGNPADQEAALYYGAVDYAYNVGKYHVTVEQYAASGLPRAAAGSVNFTSGAREPVNYVSWLDAARFCNWLTTGDFDKGVYDTSTGAALDHATAVSTINAVFDLSISVAYFLPTEDEWYKAAYYDPGSAGYYVYGTSSNTLPTAQAPPGGANSANYNKIMTGSDGCPTDVGAYLNTKSSYGAYDMAGNVWDWNETWVTADRRGVRGGAFSNSATTIHASRRSDFFDPADRFGNVGFRIASIPEPGSMTMLLACGAGLLSWRRRRNA